jgi:serine/threonine protein kinase
MLGQVIDRYTLVERLGSGGMGAVFKGHHTSLDQYRAVKVLPPHFTDNPELVARFLREAKRGAALCHPNIVRLEHVGQQDGLYFLVMDYVPGRSLRQLLDDDGPLPIDRLLPIARQVCDALAHAHAQGVVHRDVKPSNILIEEGGRAVLADFGIARWGMEQGPDLTAIGETVGTPEYMSPEQIRGEPVDARSDLYSLGVVLYEALTGELPFSARSRAHVKRQHLERPPISPRFYTPTLSPAVEQVILKALEKGPAGRYACAGQLAKALEAAVNPQAASQEVAADEAPEPVLDREPDEAPEACPTAISSAALRDWLSDSTSKAAEPQPEPPAAAPTSAAPPPAAEAGVSPRVPFRQPTLDPQLLATAQRWAREQPARLAPAAAWARQNWEQRVPQRLRQSKVALAAAAGLAVLPLLVLPRLGSASATGRFTSERTVDPKTGRELGMVRAHGIPVLVITEPEGGVTPVQRAADTARRLERLLANRSTGLLEAEQLEAIPSSSGALVLARRPEGREPAANDLVVTVDEPTAATYAQTSRTSLALWWRDVLRDQIRLARGRQPAATAATPYGRALEQLHLRLRPKRPGDWIAAADIQRAVRALPAPQRAEMEEAWHTVPAAWRGDEALPAAARETPVSTMSVAASDTLPGASPQALIDDDPGTAWLSRQGMKYQGQRHWLKVTVPPGTQVQKVEVREGSRGKSQLRIKQARVVFSDGSAQRLWRRKPTDPLRISVAPRSTRWVKLEVEKAFATRRPGSSRLCLSEVRLFGP